MWGAPRWPVEKEKHRLYPEQTSTHMPLPRAQRATPCRHSPHLCSKSPALPGLMGALEMGRGSWWEGDIRPGPPADWCPEARTLSVGLSRASWTGSPAKRQASLGLWSHGEKVPRQGGADSNWGPDSGALFGPHDCLWTRLREPPRWPFIQSPTAQLYFTRNPRVFVFTSSLRPFGECLDSTMSRPVWRQDLWWGSQMLTALPATSPV